MKFNECKIVCSRTGGSSDITFGQVYDAIFANMLEDRSKCTQFFIANNKNECEIVSGFNFLYYHSESRCFDSAIRWFDDNDIDKVLFIPGKIRVYKEPAIADGGNIFYVVSYEGSGSRKLENIDDIEIKLGLLKEEWMLCRLNPLSHA